MLIKLKSLPISAFLLRTLSIIIWGLILHGILLPLPDFRPHLPLSSLYFMILHLFSCPLFDPTRSLQSILTTSGYNFQHFFLITKLSKPLFEFAMLRYYPLFSAICKCIMYDKDLWNVLNIFYINYTVLVGDGSLRTLISTICCLNVMVFYSFLIEVSCITVPTRVGTRSIEGWYTVVSQGCRLSSVSWWETEPSVRRVSSSRILRMPSPESTFPRWVNGMRRRGNMMGVHPYWIDCNVLRRLLFLITILK